MMVWNGGEEMKYKIAICDDVEADRKHLSNLVKQWAQGAGHSLQISEFPSAESFLFRYAEENDFHILLLDIEMGVMDGVAMARKLRRENDTVQIVFVTGYSDYIAEGYEVEALHYLLKPVKEEKLSAVLERAVEKLCKNEKVLNLENAGELLRIPVYQIRYIDVQGNYITVHGREEYVVRKTLGELADMLAEDERFFRVGRSAVVNLSCISRVTKKDIYLNDGSVVPLPRGAYEKVNQAIIRME